MLNRDPFLIGGLIVAASVWIGSFVCLTIVSAVARANLEPAARVVFFRSLGRRYGVVGTTALGAVVGLGLAMTWPPDAWSGRGDALGVLVLAAVLLTAVGVRQARLITRLRREALTRPSTELTETVRRYARLATIVRSAIGLVTLAAIVVLAWALGT